MASKRIKYQGINLTKMSKDLFNKNYNINEKKLKRIHRSRAIFLAYGLEEFIFLKYLYYPKKSTDSMQSLSKC